jgi:beta-barrel assembly-enhancing protease
MRKFKLKISWLCFFCLNLGVFGLLVWANPSYSFNFGDVLKEVEKATKPPAQQKQDKPEEKKGSSLGRILKQTVNTIKALQPIGYEEEKAIGGRLAVEVFSRYGGAYNNPELLRYVNLVGQAVAEVSTRPDINYHFAILNTEYPNAFATPGGYVFVSIGLLKMLKNEAQLAGVLAHEVAHISQKHALQTMERSRSLEGISSLTLTAMDKDPALFDKVLDGLSNILFTHGLDKELEFEADKFGREFAYRVGYFPGGLQNFIRKLDQNSNGENSIFMSTHPSSRERYDRLKQSWSRYKKASLYPVFGKRFLSALKIPEKS